MFPNIPRAFIVRELDRADGSIPVAIDNLLLIAPDFINVNGTNESSERLDTSPIIHTSQTTHYNILNSFKRGDLFPSNSDSDSAELTRKNWDKIDPETRQRILSDRKRQILLKARESFINNK